MKRSKVFVFGMDGNVLDNYTLKAEAAGKAMRDIAQEIYEVEKSSEYFAREYTNTSGMNSLKQFELAFTGLGIEKVRPEVLRETEKRFRKNLTIAQRSIKIFPDVIGFIAKLPTSIHLAITTTVPIDDISTLASDTGMDKLFEVICARHGVWNSGSVKKISNFDKGSPHYDYLLDKFSVLKEDIVVFSSTTADVKNALDYGITSVAVGHIHPESAFENMKPSHFVHNYTEAYKLVELV